MLTNFNNPLDDYLRKGISAANVRQLLEQHDSFTFPHLRSGLFPACNFDDIDNDKTGMANAWLRDSACVGLALLYDKQKEDVAVTAKAILSCLHKIKPYFERVIRDGRAPTDEKLRPPVSFAGQDAEPRLDWDNSQNDAFGYVLLFIGKALSSDYLVLHDDDLAVIEQILVYLEAISYWQDRDKGHWEDFVSCKASSIGAVVAGLEAIRNTAQAPAAIDTLIDNGRRALTAILPSESLAPDTKEVDGALLFLVEPMRIVSDNMARQIVDNVEKHLVGKFGVRRYIGDSYWAPDYRTNRENSDITNLTERDKLFKEDEEAQWTLFDSLLSAYYSHRFEADGDLDAKHKSNYFLTRALRQIGTHTHEKTKREVWRIPEAFFVENGQWMPNDHIGLLWSHANLLYALDVYSEVFGDNSVISILE